MTHYKKTSKTNNCKVNQVMEKKKLKNEAIEKHEFLKINYFKCTIM